MTIACLTVSDTFAPGSQPPSGYNAWHEWAKVQDRAGLRQSYCWGCRRWLFPQEKCPHDKTERMSKRQFNEAAAMKGQPDGPHS